MSSIAPPRITRAQVFGVTLGNALEFYDFLIFSFFATQIGHTFFPEDIPGGSLLAALATFGAGFLTRPLGAIVIGGLGDRIGRRPMLIVSFALIGLASAGVAVTPSYERIGVAAPIIVLVCRLVQGFALGGEVGASTAFLIEAAPPGRRGFYVALQFAGQNVATLVAGLVGVALAAVMDDALLASLGWRIALALGVLILPIGLVLRGSLPETLAAETAAAPRPAFASYRRVITVAFFMLLSGTIVTYVMNYMTTYATTTLKLPSGAAFGATVVVGIAGVVGALAAGLAADRFGRRPAMLWPMAFGTIAVLPGFWWLNAVPTPITLYAVSLLLRLALAAAVTVALVSTTEALPPRVRSGAVAIVYAVAISVFGGSTQFVIAWLTRATGDPMAPAWYMFAAAVIGLVAMLFVRESLPDPAEAG